MSEALFDAIEFAARAHRGQCRKGSDAPYIVHPVAVGRMLLASGCSPTLAIAGFLHDVVEDTPVTLEEIRGAFGDEVARLVQGASEPDKTASWEERKKHTLHSLEEASEDVLLVTIADKIDNLESMLYDLERLGDQLWLRFSRGPEAQRGYYQGLLAVLRRRLVTSPGRELVLRFERGVDRTFSQKQRSESD